MRTQRSHVRVKICGITHPDDLEAVVDAGADAVGFNFHPESPRSVGLEAAESLLTRVPPFVQSFGVFVRKILAELQPLLAQLKRLDVVQVHGGTLETGSPGPIRYVPAFQVRVASDLQAVSSSLDVCRQSGWLPSAVLIDGYAPGLTGGTGQPAPWHLLADFDPGLPLILAGGLTPDNVADAIRCVRPFAVDVASGVESSPGRKDPVKVRDFIRNARRAVASW